MGINTVAFGQNAGTEPQITVLKPADATTPKLKINSFNVLFNSELAPAPNFSKNEILTLARGSVLVPKYFNKAENRDYSSLDLQNNVNLSFGVGLKSKKTGEIRANQAMNVGLQLTSLNNSLYSTFSSETIGTDTFKNNNGSGNQSIYTDTVKNKNFSSQFEAQILSLDVNYLFKSNTDRRFSFYTGIGFIAGLSLNSQVSSRYSEFTSVETRSNNNQNSSYGYSRSRFSDTDVYESEVIGSTNMWYTSAYVPIGLTYRLGKTNQFWNKLTLGLDVRVGVNTLVYRDIEKSVLNASSKSGLRFSYNF